MSTSSEAMIWAIFGAFLSLALEHSLGSQVNSSVWYAAAASLFIGVFSFRYYIKILNSAADLKGSTGFVAYEKLRNSLRAGGTPARLYAYWLQRALHAVEQFCGDAGLGARCLLPRPFGLQSSRPLWTIPALDRCILLAFIYPVASIVLVWGISAYTWHSSTFRAYS